MLTIKKVMAYDICLMKTKDMNYQLLSNDGQLGGTPFLASFVSQNFVSILSISFIRR